MNRKTLPLRTITVFTSILMLLAALPVLPALAATLGPNNAGAGADVSGTGTVAWINPGNITTAGTPYTTVPLTAGTSSHYLQATSYGFNIPYGSTITGIQLMINRQSSGASNPSILDVTVSLLKGGVITGDNKAQTATYWLRGAFEVATYGTTSDLWGTTWTAAEINAANFGAMLAVRDAHPSQPRTATVDYMQITVTYTPPNNTIVMNCGSGTPVVTYGSSITCEATVTRTGGTFNPTGTVAWTSNSSGSFATSPCTLSPFSAGVASCQVSYTPAAVGTGTHTLTATYSGDANFSGSQGTQAVTVNQKTATVAADAKNKTYGDDNPALTATLNGEVVGDPINYTLATTVVKFSNVGGYPITVSLGANPNYTVTPTDNTLTVNPKDASVAAEVKSKTYGDDNPALTAAVTGEVIGGDALSYTLATTAVKYSNVGGYPITVSLGANSNYTVTPTDSTLTVNAKAAAVAADAKSKTYGDDNPVLTVVVTGEVVGGDVISYTLATPAVKFSSVGGYPITVSLSANPNYTVTPTDSTLTVGPKAATVVADAKSKTYGDDNPALTAVVTGELAGGDVISYTLATSAVQLSSVGTYPITVTLDLNPNYTVIPTDSTVTVNPKAASVVVDPKSKTYGDDNPALTAFVTGEVPGGDVINYTLATTAVKFSSVGDYPITVDLGPNPNYTVTPTNSLLTINPKAATVVVAAKFKTYGDDNPALTAVVTGEVAGGDVISYTLATTAVKLSGVGTYPITTDLGPNPNYTVTPTNNILTIDPKSASVAADAKSKAYGDDNPALTVALTGEVAGGDVISYTLSTSAVKLSGVGDYPISVTLGANPNYTVTPSDSLLTVNPKTATVTADHKSKTYGADNPALTATLTDEVAGGDVISYTLSTTALQLSPVGDYPITVSLGSNPNYSVTPVDGTLTVNPIGVTITADDKSKLYGQPDPAFTYSVTSGALLSGDAFTGALTRVSGEAIGNYDILQGSLSLPAYYNLTYVPGKLFIQVAGPALTLVKTAAPQTYAKAGDVIQYSYVLTNTGNVPLEGPFTVADDKASDEACPLTPSLAMSDSLTCTASYTITAADVWAGSVTNTAAASGTYAGDAVASNNAQATVRTYRMFISIISK